jgi:hypothetical protein
LFFFHNPKAGGSSLKLILASMYAPDRICPIDETDPFQRRAAAEGYRAMQGFDLYVGHFGHDLYRAVETGHAPITNFRHPATRLVSLYNYFRFVVQVAPEYLEGPDLAAIRLAKSASFEDFVLCDDPQVAMYTCDHHFRQLANSSWSMASTRSEREVADLIAAMPWFYVCELPDASYLWARWALGWRLDRVERANVTMVEQDAPASILAMPDALVRKIAARNPRDMAIYRMAVGRLISETARSPASKESVAA